MPENEKPELVGSGSPDTIASVATAIVSESRISHKTDSTMTQRFLKFIPSDFSEQLLIKHTSAFVLLTIIATRARRTPYPIDDLDVNECYIGDYASCGLTRQQYRTALSYLCNKNMVEIIQNTRTRQKLTTGPTTVRTKVKLLSSDVWDINSESNNHSNNHSSTTVQPLAASTQCISIKKEKKEKKIPSLPAQELAKLLIKSIRTWLPNFKAPNFAYWCQQCEKILKDHEEDDARRLIEWLPESEFWRKNVLSPQKLGKQWDRLQAERQDAFFKSQFQENLAYFLECKRDNAELFKPVIIKTDFVINNKAGKDLSLRMKPEAFKAALPALVGARHG